MAIRIAPLDDNLDFPAPVAARQAARLGDATTPEGAAVVAGVFEGTPPNHLPLVAPVQAIGTQPGHGWVFSGTPGALSTLNDTEGPALGTQSVKLASSSTTAVTVEQSGLNISAHDSHLRIWIKIADMPLASIVTVYAFTNGLSGGSYYLWNIHSSATPNTDASYITSGEWAAVTLPWSSATITGNASRDKITDVRIRLSPSAAGAVMNFNGVDVIKAQTSFDKGVVSLTFDDSNITHWTTVRPYMDKYGFQGTAFTLPGNLGGGPNSMSLGQLKALQRDYGWEVASHTAWSTDSHNAFPVPDLDGDILRTRAFLKKHGFQGADMGAYPHGRITPAIVATTRKYQYAARAGAGASNQKTETLPPSDPLRIRPFGISSTTTVASVIAAIDKAVANREWLVLIFHGIKDVADTYYYPVASFQQIVDHIATSGIAVRTMTDALKGSTPAKAAQKGSIPLRVAASDVPATIADGLVGYNLPDAATSNVYFAGVTLPDDAAPGGLVSLEYTWTAPTVNTGSVFLRGDVKVLEATGSSATTPATSPPVVASTAVPGMANTTMTTVHDYTQIPARATGQKYHPVIFRNGSHASDTAAGDVRIIDARLLYTKK